jgi:hypothetical protein
LKVERVIGVEPTTLCLASTKSMGQSGKNPMKSTPLFPAIPYISPKK